jgi:hypothetical protein
MLVVSACGAKGVLASGGAGSFISHAVSKYPDHGFELRGQFSPTTSFGPHLTFDPVEKKFVVIFRVNALEVKPYCVGNSSGTDPVPTSSKFVKNAYIKASQLEADPTGEKGQNFYVAWADSMNGPWEVQKVVITAESAQAVLTGAGVHISNNALFFFDSKPGADKNRVGMAFRYTHGNGYAVANNFRGPYTAISNLSLVQPNGSEDPVLFSTAKPSALHMIWHSGPHGYHAWSTDSGKSWNGNAKTGTWAYEADVSLANGTTAYFARRERPALVFPLDAAGNGGVPKDGLLPNYLVTGVQVAAAPSKGAPKGTAYPMIQKLLSTGCQDHYTDTKASPSASSK